jgi:hypothetical protein
MLKLACHRQLDIEHIIDSTLGFDHDWIPVFSRIVYRLAPAHPILFTGNDILQSFILEHCRSEWCVHVVRTNNGFQAVIAKFMRRKRLTVPF